MQKQDNFCDPYSELICVGAVLIMINAVMSLVFYEKFFVYLFTEVSTWNDVARIALALSISIIIFEIAAIFAGYKLLKRLNPWRMFTLGYLYLKALRCLVMIYSGIAFFGSMPEKTIWFEVISLLISVFAIIVFHLPGVKWQFISVEKPQEE